MIGRLIQRLPEQMRLPLLTVVYGLAGGLAAVAFMEAIHVGFDGLWGWLTSLSVMAFLVGSFLVVSISSLAAGILMSAVFPGASGSGVPQLKTAYWNDMGEMPLRSVLVKFAGGIMTLVGGASLGREGPTVFIAGGLASNLAGWLGADRRKRRRAAAAGAAAGLAAAFNTPLAAISFVLEEILGDFNSRLLGGVMVASVVGAFTVFALVGDQPSFLMPAVRYPSWRLYIAVPVSAALAALAGGLFQKSCLVLRAWMRRLTVLPAWARPLTGGLAVWGIGVAVFLSCGRLGVFGLGYGDLSDAMSNGIGWKIAGVLAGAKLLATVLSYGTGGCGGIFAPTLFIGAMCGFFTGEVINGWIPLTGADRLIIAATGMCACFGAVVRAPVTAVLIVFEMTHQFSMVPALLLGSLISQGIGRLAGPLNFYDAILEQDGVDLHRALPLPRNLAIWRAMEVSALGTRHVMSVPDLRRETLQRVLRQYPHRGFPVITDGGPAGILTRSEAEYAIRNGTEPTLEKAVVFRADQTLGEIEKQLIQSDAGVFLVCEESGGPVTGLFTLHDLIRAQADVFD